ncbi:MAG: hypothetical protein EP332_12805 [Bacteroidetes bacterium]|nr:MAG: hypothetical protein EP332_12805 [Bacteroidota bacterium]
MNAVKNFIVIVSVLISLSVVESCKSDSELEVIVAKAMDNVVPELFYFNSGSYWIYKDQFGNYDTVEYLSADFVSDTIYSEMLQAYFLTDKFNIQWNRTSDSRLNFYHFTSYFSVDPRDKYKRTQDKLMLASGSGAIAEEVFLIYPMMKNTVEPQNPDSSVSYIGFFGTINSFSVGLNTFNDVYEYETFQKGIMNLPMHYWVAKKVGIVQYSVGNSVFKLQSYFIR